MLRLAGQETGGGQFPPPVLFPVEGLLRRLIADVARDLTLAGAETVNVKQDLTLDKQKL